MSHASSGRINRKETSSWTGIPSKRNGNLNDRPNMGVECSALTNSARAQKNSPTFKFDPSSDDRAQAAMVRSTA
jgi:hypothetical protein